MKLKSVKLLLLPRRQPAVDNQFVFMGQFQRASSQKEDVLSQCFVKQCEADNRLQSI